MKKKVTVRIFCVIMHLIIQIKMASRKKMQFLIISDDYPLCDIYEVYKKVCYDVSNEHLLFFLWVWNNFSDPIKQFVMLNFSNCFYIWLPTYIKYVWCFRTLSKFQLKIHKDVKIQDSMLYTPMFELLQTFEKYIWYTIYMITW